MGTVELRTIMMRFKSIKQNTLATIEDWHALSISTAASCFKRFIDLIRVKHRGVEDDYQGERECECRGIQLK